MVSSLVYIYEDASFRTYISTLLVSYDPLAPRVQKTSGQGEQANSDQV